MWDIVGFFVMLIVRLFILKFFFEKSFVIFESIFGWFLIKIESVYFIFLYFFIIKSFSKFN